MKSHALWLALILLLAAFMGPAAAQIQAIAVNLGQAMVTLNGPWLFHVGDNARWADSEFDDSGWEHMDLSAAPGATDGDVGLPNYAQGWSAKGHPGYYGYAWYRIHLNVRPPVGKSLALLGPWAVDSAYQVYENGRLLGGVGNFSGTTPIAYGYHYPAFFALPSTTHSSVPMVIAIRVWMGPWDMAAPGSGGIHIAPVIGERDAIAAQYHLHWLKIIEGYVVDAVPALLFFLAALMVLCLQPFDRRDRVYLWLAAALTLSGIQRGNQAFFFWWQIETVQDFVYFILVLTGSLNLGAWMMAWRGWFKIDRPRWLPKAIAALTLVLMLAQLLGRPWLFHATFPHLMVVTVHYLATCVRLAFLLVLFWIIYQGIRRQGREGWYALPAVLAIGAVLFTAELVAVHVPGIWFPWGIGLSLSECASTVFVLLLFVLLLRRLWSYTRHLQSA
ncbi:MAG: glycoside hydrolase [Gammaproteobacteria bacterium]